VYGTLGSGGCVKNLPCVGAEVYTKIGGDWSGCLCAKKGHGQVGTNSLFYVNR